MSKTWTTPRDPQCPSCGKTFIPLADAIKLTPGVTHDIACQSCGYVIPMEVDAPKGQNTAFRGKDAEGDSK